MTPKPLAPILIVKVLSQENKLLNGGGMKKLGALLLSMYLLTGCEEVFRGQLELSQDIVIQKELNRQEQREYNRCERRNFRGYTCKRLLKKLEKYKQVAEAGTHAAKIIPGKKKIKVKLLNEKGKTKAEFSVKVPKNTDLPRNNGSIDLPNSKTGFPYDVKGNLNTEVSDGETQYLSESCSWQEPRTVCRIVREPIPNCRVNDDNGRRRGRRDCMRRVRRCHTEYVTYYGYQNVEFFYRHTLKNLVFTMIKPESRNTMGEFEGQYQNNEKIYTYRGQCR